MAYDFPASPTPGQTFQNYTWDGEKWTIATPTTAALTTPKKNYIINGAMQVSQENGTTAGNIVGAVYYTVDQFFGTGGGTSGQASAAQVASTTPAGSPNRFRVTVTTADAAVAAGDYVVIAHNIEGLRVADLLFGTASAKSITLRFGVKAPAGTYCVSFKNSAGNRCYVAEYTITGGEANTDVVKTITLAGDQSGTWLKDNGSGVQIVWGLMAGTTFQQAANSWGTANALGSPNQFTFMGTLSNVFELFDVSLTEGTVAPTYQVPDYTSEILLCKRYYQKYGGETQFDAALAVYATAASPHNCPLVFFTEMRVAPTPNFVGTWLYTNGTAISHAIKSKTTILFTITTSAAGYANYYNNVAGTSYMALNSRM
jgi:hypothetical protein